jgi:hypothetical protein
MIINISEIRIYLWTKGLPGFGKEPGVCYGSDSPSHGVLNREQASGKAI